MTRQTKIVSEKSTKQDILTAYQELLGELNHEPLTQSSLTQMEKHDTTLITDLKESIDTLKEHLDRSLDALSSKFADAEKIQSALREMHEFQKKTLSSEKLTAAADQTREKEEYTYEFSKQKKRLEEELVMMRQKAEAELAERREKLKMQEDELVDLRNQVKTFEPRLQKAINETVTQATNDLKRTFEHEKALLVQEAKLTQSLLEQKVTLHEQTLARQTAEMDRLNTVANQATQQMTRIAERAVTKAPEVQSSPSNPKVNS